VQPLPGGWQTVNSGFFSRRSHTTWAKKIVADGARRQVPHQPDPAAAFVMVQADFSFVVIE
jgi:hypothetical protein